MAKTPSQLKNAVPPCFRAIIDPYPKLEHFDRVWERFESKCIYCAKALSRGNRDAFCDHLLPFAEGGANDIGNFALTCAKCSDEKKNEPWESFLRKKVSDENLFRSKKNKIEKWLKDNSEEHRLISEELRNALAAASSKVRAEIDSAVKDLKAKRRAAFGGPDSEQNSDPNSGENRHEED